LSASEAELERVVQTDVVPAFAGGSAFTVGVEEELLLVDPVTHALRTADPTPLAATFPPHEGALLGEVSAAEIELISPVCSNGREAMASLRALRGHLRAAGETVIAAGVHPDGGFADARPAPGARHKVVLEELHGVLRTPTAALQVHIGMPDPDSAIRAHNALRIALPLLQALAAASPFWHGHDSGLASARAAILRSYPRMGIPPAFGSYDEFVATMTELATAAGLTDYTYFWWDVRPHPRLGTVEVRAMDTQWSYDRAAALTALVHGLALDAVQRPPARCLSHEALDQSAFAALRHGIDARVSDGDGRVRPVRELAAEAVARARPHLVQRGGEDALDAIGEILAADEPRRQRSVHARAGMAGLLADLTHRTMAGGDRRGR
jgi:glutamate---cysteine ligase / carboxylate-amine ligase